MWNLEQVPHNIMFCGVFFSRRDGIPLKRQPQRRLHIVVIPAQVNGFFRLLSKGFKVDVTMGSSVKEVLCKELGLDEAYVEQSIQTIFLNHKPVDHIDTALITKGSTLALSAAMPGLAGATLRRAGHFSAMRYQISHKDETVSDVGKRSELTLKLFNLVARELGPLFLSRGIRVRGIDFKDMILNHLDDFQGGLLEFRLDDRAINQDRLLALEWEEFDIFLTL